MCIGFLNVVLSFDSCFLIVVSMVFFGLFCKFRMVGVGSCLGIDVVVDLEYRG